MLVSILGTTVDLQVAGGLVYKLEDRDDRRKVLVVNGLDTASFFTRADGNPLGVFCQYKGGSDYLIYCNDDLMFFGDPPLLIPSRSKIEVSKQDRTNAVIIKITTPR